MYLSFELTRVPERWAYIPKGLISREKYLTVLEAYIYTSAPPSQTRQSCTALESSQWPLLPEQLIAGSLSCVTQVEPTFTDTRRGRKQSLLLLLLLLTRQEPKDAQPQLGKYAKHVEFHWHIKIPSKNSNYFR